MGQKAYPFWACPFLRLVTIQPIIPVIFGVLFMAFIDKLADRVIPQAINISLSH